MLSYGTIRQEDGVYQINTPLDLCLFSEIVNEGEINANAVLNADLDMIEFQSDFVPIGTSSKIYSGKFDGQGHTISNLNITGKDYVGVFGVIGQGVEIQNLNLDATCSVTGANYVGGLVGYARKGTVKIIKCGTAATVTATGGYAGGFVGSVSLLSTVTIQKSYNQGKVVADSMAAALVAPCKGKLNISDCYNAGKIKGAFQGWEFAYSDNVLQFQNCYDAYSNQVERVTPIDVMSGALCYLLNTGSGKTIWRQNIDNGRKPDGHPVLKTSSGVVYYKDGIYTNLDKEVSGYRYYKWEILAIRNGRSGTIQFSEFDILDQDGEEYADLTVYNGTESDIWYEDWDNAGDNEVTTKYCGSFHGYAYFLFDAQEEVMPYGYRIYTANDTQRNPGRNPSTWRLYGSNKRTEDPDDDSWELIEQDDDNTLQAVNYTPFDCLLKHKDEETGIKSLTPALSKSEGAVYNLAGQRISKLQKGINIVDGKKVVVR